MPLDASILTKKIGPLPGFVWLGVAGAGFYFLVLPRLKGGSGSALSGVAASSAGSGSSAGSTGTSPTQPSATARQQFSFDNLPGIGPAIHGWDQSHPGIAIRGQASASAPITGFIPWGSSFNTTGASVPGSAAYPGQTPQWAPVQGGFVNLDDFAQAMGGAGGTGGAAPPGRSAAIGSRSVPGMHYFHPAVKQDPQYVHYIQGTAPDAGTGGAPRGRKDRVSAPQRAGVGGADAQAAHAANLTRVAAQTGVHPARLMALNPHPHKLIRIA